MSNKIVFINQSSGYIMIDIIRSFEGLDIEKYLVSGSLSERNHKLPKEVVFNKIIAYDRSSNIRRIFSWLYAFFQIVFVIKLKYSKTYLFIVSNPPFATLLPLFCSNNFSLLIFDVYPDSLVEFKVLKKESMFIKAWEKVNKKIFSKADFIFTISESMKAVLSKYAGSKPVNVIPIWSDNEFLKYVKKSDNPFVDQHGLKDKFIVLYSGNFGRTHPVEILLDVALRLKDENKIVFLMIGGGEKFEFIKEEANKLSLTNCIVLPWQPVQSLPFTLSSADVGVVMLGKEASSLSIPSKVFSLFAIGAPLLCVADKDSELARMVESGSAGKCFSHDEIGQICDYIKQLANDNSYRNELSKNSLKISASYTPENAKLFREFIVQKLQVSL